MLLFSGSGYSRKRWPILSPLTGNVKILFTGDSITAGDTSGMAGNGPRLAVYNGLVADQGLGLLPNTLSFTFVGPVNTGSAPTNLHYGVDGTTVGDHLANTAAACAGITPDIVCCMLGTNDVNHGTPQDGLKNYIPLFNLYKSLWPNARYLAADLVADNAGSWLAWQQAIRGKFDQLRLLGFNVVDLNSDVLATPADFNVDLVHPQESTGFPKLAASWRTRFRWVLGYD